MSEIEKYYNGEIHVDFVEDKLKITQPMFEPGELESFDNYIHSIVEDYSKMKLHEKEQILTQRIIIKQEEEIKKLKSIIKGLDNTIENLEEVIEQEDNIIKEVREYIDKFIKANYEDVFNQEQKEYMVKILQILDKGE